MKSYTPMQAFFWLIAGSEIHVLKDCKNDYNRHASIGLVLFMTTIFATLSGFSAGYFFSHGNVTISVLFSFLWAMLIYSIDRSMIVSLKKKSETEKLGFIERLKYYFIPFISRAIVGTLIGFFMSIPLEIIVFQDNILLEIDDENKERVLNEGEFVKIKNGLPSKETEKGLAVYESGRLDSLSKTMCPEPDYRQELSDFEQCKPETEKFNAIYINSQKVYDQTQRYVWIAGVQEETQLYKDARYNRSIAKKNYDNQNSQCLRHYNNAIYIKNNWLADLKKQKKSNDSLATVKGQEISIINSQADTAKIERDSLLKRLNGFTRQYEALTHASSKEGNSSLLFLLWLIRFIFIGIEILPMLTKIMTPIGDYDRTIERREEEYDDFLTESKIRNKKRETDRTKSESGISEETEAKRKEIETTLNNNILEEVARVQTEVANEMLKEWEKQEKAKASSKVADFIKSK
jgi:Domain of unknown function (DUF4407)